MRGDAKRRRARRRGSGGRSCAGMPRVFARSRHRRPRRLHRRRRRPCRESVGHGLLRRLPGRRRRRRHAQQDVVLDALGGVRLRTKGTATPTLWTSQTHFTTPAPPPGAALGPANARRRGDARQPAAAQLAARLPPRSAGPRPRPLAVAQRRRLRRRRHVRAARQQDDLLHVVHGRARERVRAGHLPRDLRRRPHLDQGAGRRARARRPRLLRLAPARQAERHLRPGEHRRAVPHVVRGRRRPRRLDRLRDLARRPRVDEVRA